MTEVKYLLRWIRRYYKPKHDLTDIWFKNMEFVYRGFVRDGEYKDLLNDFVFDVVPSFHSYIESSVNDPQRRIVCCKMWRMIRITGIEWNLLVGDDKSSTVKSLMKRICNIMGHSYKGRWDVDKFKNKRNN